MTTKTKNIVQTAVFAVLLFALAFACWFGRDKDFSNDERRVLASFPEITWERLLNVEFMKDFDTYSQDQFPLRDTFRGVKTAAQFYVFGRAETNDLYMAEGHISKLDGEASYPMLDHAAERFQYLYDTYLADKNMNIYFSVVPDKNYFMAESNGYPALDYAKLTGYMLDKTQYMEYIDIYDKLYLDDYYCTDSHWRQENLPRIAAYIADKMGVKLDAEYTENVLNIPFEGVYVGQSALPLKPDTIVYLTNEILENCIVTSYDTGTAKPGVMYDFEKAEKGDAYDLYLSGANPFVTIENPNAETDRELYIFRDSFGSSIAPLFAEGYAKVTVIDIRYVQSAFLGSLIDFTNGSDVLFLYSTGMLNSSLGLR
ncbi:MAG: hypothetical protein IJ017_03830 [Oscillospiraceae bacterium]|nr:hypothetical protein [Oscillospiraceae bacterium]